jgi:hypothetical protein
MTLIVSAATTEYILQAADRRLSRGRIIKEFRDDETKAIAFCNTAIFGVTGRVYIDDAESKRTDHWLCEVLAGSTLLLEQLYVLRDRANNAFAHKGDPMAFATTGWCAQGDDRVIPFLALVTNYHHPQSGKVTEVQPTFALLVRPLKDSEKTLLHFVGAELHPSEDEELEGIVSGLASQVLTVEGALHAMAQVIRRVADRDETVGRGVLLSAVPRQAVVGTAMGFWAYMPADVTSTVSKSPHFVCGGAIIRDVESSPIY